MNFVDAAVSLLREVPGPLHVEELCRLALERGLLDSPGQSPLRSLKGRLTTELKRGPESRVVRVDDDLWALADAGRNGESELVAEAPPGAPDEVRAREEATDAAAEAEIDGEAAEAYDDDDDDDDDFDDEFDDDEDDDDDLDAEAEGKTAREESAGQIDAGDADLEEDTAEASDEEEPEPDALGRDDDVDMDDRDTEVREDRAAERMALEREVLTPEEQELIEVYGGDAGTAQVGALVEYRDEQTADEDRPMVPETLQERRGGRQREDWKARRERMREKRRERREERDRGKGGREQAAPAPAEPSRAAAESPEAEAPPRREVAMPAGEGDLARLACEVLASIKGAQPVPVRQLAQMMRKRRLVEVDPERLWRPLKSALLADYQRRAAAGLPPRIAYRGRDLFAYRPSANAELEAVEGALEAAAHRLRGATERALAARLVELPLPVLEQVVQLYLVQTGWRDVEWIKRVDRSGYAVAREPGEGAQVMISARAGNQEVDRRGVGELRAGVAAKDLSRGLLLAPREMGSEARSELERPGKPVSAICGLPWMRALVDAGIGVALRTMPVAYLDAELFDRLTEG
ncbi:MAG TPA: HTH domain-containing protein [Kofleriaceae bacterium]|nr:HTH domain-containing protein [Kofleriaceae bacterium]